jgi:hypothetical protein
VATPGDSGGGSTGTGCAQRTDPGQVSLGITHNEGTTRFAGAGARPEPRAPCGEKPNPQITEHEAARGRLADDVFLFSKGMGVQCRFG